MVVSSLFSLPVMSLMGFLTRDLKCSGSKLRLETARLLDTLPHIADQNLEVD